MAKSASGDIIAVQIKVLHDELFNAKAHFDIFMGLREQWNEHIREIQNSPAFWHLTVKSHIDAAVSHLCRAYDSNERGLHLSSFLETVEENVALFCEGEFRKRHAGRAGLDGLAKYCRTVSLSDLAMHKDHCSKSDPLVALLRRWRNNRIAHFNHDEALSLKPPMHKTDPLLFEHIKTLIERGLDIVNHYSGLLDANTYSNRFASNQGSDYTLVLVSLRFARVAQRWNQRRFRKVLRRRATEAYGLRS